MSSRSTAASVAAARTASPRASTTTLVLFGLIGTGCGDDDRPPVIDPGDGGDYSPEINAADFVDVIDKTTTTTTDSCLSLSSRQYPSSKMTGAHGPGRRPDCGWSELAWVADGLA